MSILKEYIREKHNLAESTKFMWAIFERRLPIDLWYDFTYQKSLFYETIEDIAKESGFIDDILGVQRYQHLRAEYSAYPKKFKYRPEVIEYNNYLHNIPVGNRNILAHLYTWHMGDMYGGQMIKKVLNIQDSSLTFENRIDLIQKLENKLDLDLVPETVIAFDWAYKILNSYDESII
jgi:heme oxygenase